MGTDRYGTGLVFTRSPSSLKNAAPSPNLYNRFAAQKTARDGGVRPLQCNWASRPNAKCPFFAAVAALVNVSSYMRSNLRYDVTPKLNDSETMTQRVDSGNYRSVGKLIEGCNGGRRCGATATGRAVLC